MRPRPPFAVKKPRWLAASTGVAIIAVALYLVFAWWAPWQPGRFWGLVFGSLAAALFANAGLYPLRRRWLAWPWRNVQTWLQLHIYGSTLALLFVFIHVGFEWPAGTFGWWLLGLSVWTTVTGLVGVWLQKWVPVVLARNVRIEAIYERIPELVARLSSEAATITSGAGDALAALYARDLRPLLAAPAPRWAYLFDVRGPRTAILESLSRLQSFVVDADRSRLNDLTVVINEKIDLDAQLSLQRALRLWLVTHVPAAMLLLGLLIVHIGAVVYF